MDDEDAGFTDYFNVIRGDKGGIMTAMLTAPNENDRPLFTANNMKAFPQSLPKNIPTVQVLRDIVTVNSSRRKRRSSSNNFQNLLTFELQMEMAFWGYQQRYSKQISGPRYSGKYLHGLLREALGKKNDKCG